MLERAGIEFRRVGELPPYVFAAVDRLKLELRRAGEDLMQRLLATIGVRLRSGVA